MFLKPEAEEYCAPLQREKKTTNADAITETGLMNRFLFFMENVKGIANATSEDERKNNVSCGPTKGRRSS